MNNTFDIKRFGLVMRKDFQENWKRHSLQFLAMLGIIAAVLCFQYESEIHTTCSSEFCQVNSYANASLLIAGSILFLALGIVFASTLMEPMRNKTKKISFLIVPASDLEKYLSRWVIVVVGYTIAFFLALWLADLFRVAIFSIRYPNIDVEMLNFRELINTNYYRTGDVGGYAFFSTHFFYMCLSFFFLLQSICVLGSTFWEKASFVKTFAASLVIVFSFLLVSRWTILLFFQDFNQFSRLSNSKLDFSESLGFLILTGVFVFFALVNWTIAYFRFRESEIIKRW